MVVSPWSHTCIYIHVHVPTCVFCIHIYTYAYTHTLDKPTQCTVLANPLSGIACKTIYHVHVEPLSNGICWGGSRNINMTVQASCQVVIQITILISSLNKLAWLDKQIPHKFAPYVEVALTWLTCLFQGTGQASSMQMVERAWLHIWR